MNEYEETIKIIEMHLRAAFATTEILHTTVTAKHIHSYRHLAAIDS